MDSQELANSGRATISTSQDAKKEHLFKILVIGELGTGKTSFIKVMDAFIFSSCYVETFIQ